jgi:formylglycine-generating enzyme required for sulfatase activity
MYYRSYDVAGDDRSGGKDYPAMVSTFCLDKYEITVGRFRAFVKAGMGAQSNPPVTGVGAHASIERSGWDANWNAMLPQSTDALVAAVKCNLTFQVWTDEPGANENRPMNCITWYEAMAFCAWDGGYLPTEAEWNYAATGGDQQRAYPWSSPAASLAVDGSYASYNDGIDCVGDGMSGCTLTDLVPVGMKPKGNGRWGQSDLAGNVYEWTLDWDTEYVTPCTDCAALTTPPYRIRRGGDFGDPTRYLRAGDRNGDDPKTRAGYIGARCGRPKFDGSLVNSQ